MPDHMTRQVRTDDVEAIKLEFFAKVKFVIGPSKKVAVVVGGAASLGQNLSGTDYSVAFRLQELQSFIEKKGKELTKVPELLQYFALPWVPDPQSHPLFHTLFTPTWQTSLRHKLEDFVMGMAQPAKEPEIYSLTEVGWRDCECA